MGDSMSDHGLKAIVADLHDLGYTGADIARVVQRSPQRINAILRDIGLTVPPLRTIEDLPPHMRQRVEQWREFQSEMCGSPA